MRRALCALLAGAVLCVSLGTAEAAEQRAVLTMRVNTVTKGEAMVTLHDEDVLVRRADLIDAGLKAFPFNAAGKPDDLISLASLRPDLTFRIDDVSLTLDLTVTANHLAGTVVDFRPHQDIALAKPVRSAFLNYSVGMSNETGATFAGEFGTHIGAGVLSSTQSFSRFNSYDSSLTRWIVDSPSADRRTTVGDVLTSTGDFGGTVAIAGIGVERYFGLDPNAVKTVLPQISGNALTPSTADVYVNGVLTRHEVLPPGQFSFQDLPIGEGPNNTTVVVTDAFGRQQTYSNYFYGADALLARGLSDFSYSAGVLHSQFGEDTRHGVAAAGRYAFGLTDNITGGGRVELSSTLASFGPNFSFRLRQGILSTAAAVSRDGSSTGGAALLAYQYTGHQATGAVSLAYESPHYAALGLNVWQDRPLLNASVSVSRQLNRRTGIGVSYIEQNDRDSGRQGGLQVFENTLLSPTTQLQINQTLTNGNRGKQLGFAATLNFLGSNGMNAAVTAGNSGGVSATSVQVERAAGSQTPSLGYTLSASQSGGQTSGFVSADYRGSYGDYIANLGTAGGQNSMAVTMAGGVVFIGGKIFATQAVTDSYALVDTGGLANVRILANNVVVGRTNKAGYLVVPSLGSYYNNDISIASQDTPLDYRIDEQTQRLAPMYHSGGVVRFGVNKVHPVTGSLMVELGKADVAPAFGVIEVQTAAGVTAKSDIGENGEFYFDQLPAGTHHAKILFKEGTCAFDITVPETKAMFVKLGTLLCTNGVRS